MGYYTVSHYLLKLTDKSLREYKEEIISIYKKYIDFRANNF